MTDAEMEFQMERLAEKKRPSGEIRDFCFARQALKELAQNR
jgi:ribosomal protein S14